MLVNPAMMSVPAKKHCLNANPQSINIDALSKNIEYSKYKGLSTDLARSYFNQISFRSKVNTDNQVIIKPEDIEKITDAFFDELKNKENLTKKTVKEAKEEAFKKMRIPDMDLEIEDIKNFPYPESISKTTAALHYYDGITNKHYMYVNFEDNDRTEIIKTSVHEFTHFLQSYTQEAMDIHSEVLKSKHDSGNFLGILSAGSSYFEDNLVHYGLYALSTKEKIKNALEGENYKHLYNNILMMKDVLEGEKPEDFYNYIVEKIFREFYITSPEDRLTALRYFQNEMKKEAQAYTAEIRASEKLSEPVDIIDEIRPGIYEGIDKYFTNKIEREKDRPYEGYPEEIAAISRINYKLYKAITRKQNIMTV